MDRSSHHKLTYYDHMHVVVWHYHLSGHQAKVVALGGITKRKGVSSRANLHISVKVLVGKIATTGHHARAVSPNYSLEAKEQEIKSNEAKSKRQ